MLSSELSLYAQTHLPGLPVRSPVTSQAAAVPMRIHIRSADNVDGNAYNLRFPQPMDPGRKYMIAVEHFYAQRKDGVADNDYVDSSGEVFQIEWDKHSQNVYSTQQQTGTGAGYGVLCFFKGYSYEAFSPSQGVLVEELPQQVRITLREASSNNVAETYSAQNGWYMTLVVIPCAP